MIPVVDKNSIRTAMRIFDGELRSSPDWAKWEDNKSHKFAIREGGRIYPVKKIISMATGVPVGGGKGSSQANEYIRNLSFTVVDLPHNNTSRRHPDWTREQLIVALDFYLRHREKVPNVGSLQIRELTTTIQAIGVAIGHKLEGTYRSQEGVHAALMNFCSLDPTYTANGRVGLPNPSRLAREIWRQFVEYPKECARVAAAVVGELNHIATNAGIGDDSDEFGAEEGSLLSRAHRRRERNRGIVKKKKALAIKTTGTLICEVCSFNFVAVYGERGSDFMECHHKIPVASLRSPSKTRLSDLALVCANCHRMIHAKADGLSVEGLRALLTSAKNSDH